MPDAPSLSTTLYDDDYGHVPQGLCLTLAFAIHHALVMTTEAQTNPGSIPLSGEQLGRNEPSERVNINKGAPQRYTNLWVILKQVDHHLLQNFPSQNAADMDWMAE